MTLCTSQNVRGFRTQLLPCQTLVLSCLTFFVSKQCVAHHAYTFVSDMACINCAFTQGSISSYRRARDTAKPQFISEFSVKASRRNTDSWRDLPSRNLTASSSDHAELKRSVLLLCAVWRTQHILQSSTAHPFLKTWSRLRLEVHKAALLLSGLCCLSCA